MTYSRGLARYNGSPLVSPVCASGGIELYREITSSLGSGSAGAWPTANKAIYMPLSSPVDLVVTGFRWANVTTGTDSIDIGLYADGFARLGQLGGVALAGGAASVQSANLATSVTLAAGVPYYLGVAMNGTTNTIARSATTLGPERLLGMFEQATAYPLPDPAVPATISITMIPTVFLLCSNIPTV